MFQDGGTFEVTTEISQDGKKEVKEGKNGDGTPADFNSVPLALSLCDYIPLKFISK